ncbi:MAG: hypothetical protein KDH19_01495 [Geminicoccaceae bacterium]|nr:hypothetical protein [Geminicoccaceae bacterium]
MSEFPDRLLQLVAADGMPWVLSGAIVLAAIWLWSGFSRKSRALSRALDDAIRTVEEVDGQTAFRNRFPAVFKRLAENPGIGENWRAYAATLTLSAGDDEPVGYTRRPMEAFNETLPAAAGINLRFYSAIPNFLVSTGLLFSFIGLVAALYFASSGVTARDVAQAQGALASLLQAATFKFSTSIAGLATSLIFSWREKAALYRLQWRTQRLCALLEARMKPVTTESLIAAQLAEIREVNRQVRRLSRSVYVRVPQAVEEELAGKLDRPLDILKDAVVKAAARLEAWPAGLPSFEPLPDRAPDPGRSKGVTSAAADRPIADEPGPVTDVSAARAEAGEPPDMRSGELRQMLDRRLANVLGLLGDGIAQVRGVRSASLRRRHEAVVELLEHTHDRIRDARNALGALLEHESTGSAALRGALRDIDSELRRSREELQQAAEDLGEER